MKLDGLRAVVTGASRGIGAAVARALDAQGAYVVLVARGAAPLKALAAELRNASSFPGDLRSAFAARDAAEAAVRLLGGPIDILVNSAGVFALANVAATDDATIDSMLSLNVAAPFRLMRAFLPGMVARKAGHIVTIGSVADRHVFAGNAAYAASKYGSRALHEATLAETRGTGVRVTLVSPGPVDTTVWDPYNPDGTPGLTPRAGMLRAEQVSDAVVWAITRPPDVNIDELRLTHA